MQETTHAPKLPNLTRLNRSLGLAHEDLNIVPAFNFARDKITSRLRNTSYNNGYYPRYIEELFLHSFQQSDAEYRGDFLSELLDNPQFRKEFDKIFYALPGRRLRHISEEDAERLEHYEKSEEPWARHEKDRILNGLKSQAGTIRKYLELPQTLENMTQLTSSSTAVREIVHFARKSRRCLDEFSHLAQRLRRIDFISKEGVDIRYANKCVDEMQRDIQKLEDAIAIRNSFAYYLALAIPFEEEFEGERIQSCKSKFIDEKERKGKILQAINPLYGFDSIPNDILWCPRARNTFVLGPNSQGKSVYVQTIGLNTHLSMNCRRSFAEYCELSPVRKIHPCFDLGACLEEGHFLTGAEKITDMLKDLKPEDLLLFDETGGGTEPATERWLEEGLSDAAIKYHYTSFCITHDKGTWNKHRGKKGVQILRVADINDEKRKYQVWPGIPRGGYGKKIATRLGIDPRSVDRAFKKGLTRQLKLR
jgi:dsDNA-specific endonuclease/ATPase MutS2